MNAPAIFQQCIIGILRETLDHYVFVYLDNTLIYRKTMVKHVAHVQRVLQNVGDWVGVPQQTLCPHWHKQAGPAVGTYLAFHSTPRGDLHTALPGHTSITVYGLMWQPA